MHRAQEMADELGISIRTFYRRVETGEIESFDTISGKRYRVAADGRPTTDSVIRRAPQASELRERSDELEARVAALEAEVKGLRTTLKELVEWTTVASSCLEDLAIKKRR